MQTWNAFAATITKTNPITGKTYSPTGFNEFVALTTKFLQVTPAGTIPTTPPSRGFAGDAITILATAPSASGAIRFTASGANSANVKTEFLIQPLKNSNRTPSAKCYRSKGFFGFVSGTLSKDIGLPQGSYAVGYRFVNAATGQETSPLYLAGVLNVTPIPLAGSGSNSSSSTHVGKKRKAA